jgi:hypothetical protein
MGVEEYNRCQLPDVYLKYEGYLERYRAERFEEWEMLKIQVMYQLFQPAYKFKGSVEKNIKNPYAEKKEPQKEPRSIQDVKFLTDYWNTLKYKKVN